MFLSSPYAVLPARYLGRDVFLDLPLPPNLPLPLSPSVEAGDSVVLLSRFLPDAPLKPELLPALFEDALGLAVDRATLGSSVTTTAPWRGFGVTVVDIAPSGGGCLMKLGSVGRGLAAKWTLGRCNLFLRGARNNVEGEMGPVFLEAGSSSSESPRLAAEAPALAAAGGFTSGTDPGFDLEVKDEGFAVEDADDFEEGGGAS